MQQGFTTRRTNALSSPSPIFAASQKTLLCKFHPGNNLHTFCSSVQCLLPMCTFCITVHNQDHRQARSHGNYVDLYQLIRDTVSTIEEQQRLLQQLSGQYVQDYANKKTIGDHCRSGLNKARNKLHEEIDRIFDRMSIDIQQKISTFQQQLHSLYNELENRIHENYNMLNKQKQNLTKFSQDLTNSTHSNLSMYKRSPSTQGFTPNQTNQTGFYYESTKSQNDLQSDKQDHKILKTLIEFHSQNLGQKNRVQITKLKQQTTELKQIDLYIDIDSAKIAKSIKQICNNGIEIKGKSRQPNKQSCASLRQTNRQIKTYESLDSRTNLSQNGKKEQMEQIIKQANQKLRKLQMQGEMSQHSKRIEDSGLRQGPSPVRDKNNYHLHQYQPFPSPNQMQHQNNRVNITYSHNEGH